MGDQRQANGCDWCYLPLWFWKAFWRLMFYVRAFDHWRMEFGWLVNIKCLVNIKYVSLLSSLLRFQESSFLARSIGQSFAEFTDCLMRNFPFNRYRVPCAWLAFPNCALSLVLDNHSWSIFSLSTVLYILRISVTFKYSWLMIKYEYCGDRNKSSDGASFNSLAISTRKSSNIADTPFC